MHQHHNHNDPYYRIQRKQLKAAMASIRSKSNGNSSRSNELYDDGIFEYKQGQPVPFCVSGDNAVDSISSFDDAALGLDQKLVKNIVAKLQLDKPSPVQCQAMPQMMADLDLLCCSHTNSGKTTAYIIPLINLILQEKKSQKTSLKDPLQGIDAGPRALIFVPTRELAEQVARDANLLAEDLSRPVETVALYGGHHLEDELEALKKRRPSIIVATPGRLIHILLDFEVLTLKNAKYLVVDEADVMYDRGFFSQIGDVIKEYMLPKEKRVNIMFSATFERQIQTYARKHLRDDHVFVAVGYIGGAAPNIKQDIRMISSVEKRSELLRMIEDEVDIKNTKVLVFCNKIETVIKLEQSLLQRNWNPAAIHSELHQAYRDQALFDFNEGCKKILIATSVASRGLNIEGPVYVINFDFPREITDYVQRIGRARGPRRDEIAVATSFFDCENNDEKEILPDLCKILRRANHDIPREFKRIINMMQKAELELEKEFFDDDMKNKIKKFTTRRLVQVRDDAW